MNGFLGQLEGSLNSSPQTCYDRYDPRRLVEFFGEHDKLEELVSFLRSLKLPDNPWISEVLRITADSGYPAD
jgi:hypothetical protein